MKTDTRQTEIRIDNNKVSWKRLKNHGQCAANVQRYDLLYNYQYNNIEVVDTDQNEFSCPRQDRQEKRKTQYLSALRRGIAWRNALISI